jgi:glycosyltransferase involved in cell wall biosynthesis
MTLTVAIDARKLVDFGIGSYIEGLVRGFASLDREKRFVLLAPAAHRELLQGLPANFEWVDEDAAGYSLREQFALSRQLEHIRPDLFHSPHYVLPARTPARVVVTIHDLIHLVHPEFLPHPLALPYARWMLARAVRRATRLLTVSEATANDLRKRLAVREGQITVAWNGVDDRFRAARTSEEVRSELGALGLEPGYFLFVGNPKPHKNLDRLLAAFERLDDPAARLVVVGARTPPTSDAGAKVRHLGRVDGARLPGLYRGALALVFPSLYEGFGLPVAEAMAAGLPVIASDTPAIAEIADDAAELVDPLDVEALAAAMRRLAADPERRKALAAAGLVRSDRFRWTETARRTLAVYDELLTGKTG